MRGASPGATCISEDALAAFVEGAVDAPGLAAIEEHVADCAECRSALARLAGVLHPTAERSAPSADGEAVVTELPAGARVGRYVIDRLIGTGAMGAVYAARDPHLDRTVAVKLLRADVFSDDARLKMRARLLREAQSMARLSHPEVIAVYDVGAHGDQLFVAMEYVEGQTLRQWRVAQHRDFAEILQAYERAGSGLAAAHESGLVHRDFKPDNVLVGRDGRVRVTDFGLARNVDQPEPRSEPRRDDGPALAKSVATTLTRTGMLLGTPAYMAPEQLRGQVADARSDVFSFCVALYEALYGERPFDGSTVHVLQQAIDAGAIRRAPIMTPVPGWVRAVLLRGLCADPEQRFATMRGLLDALRTAHAVHRRRTRRRIALGVTILLPVAAVVVYASGVPAVVRGRAPLSAAPTIEDGGPSREVAVTAIDPPRLPLAPDPAPPDPPMASAPAPRHPLALGTRPASGRAAGPSLEASALAPGAASPSPRRPPPAVGNNGALILE